MDTAQWPREIAVKLIEDTVVGTKQTTLEKKAKPQKEEALNCPRCHSINTKFCYYNNYSLTQPRYFCKTCKRYWTVGGSLRNIPVGGTSKKNKRSSLSSSSSNSSPSTLTKNIKLPDLITDNCTQNPKIHDSQDLNLTYPNISDLIQQNNINNTSASLYSSTSISTTVNTTTTSNSHLSALQLLPGITSSSSGLHSFMPSVQVHADPSSFYRSCGFPIQDFKPTLNFSLDEIGGSGFANLHGVDHQETSGRLSFPFEDLRQVSSSTNVSDQNNNKEHEQEQQGYLTGYWSGMLGGGGSW